VPSVIRGATKITGRAILKGGKANDISMPSISGRLSGIAASTATQDLVKGTLTHVASGDREAARDLFVKAAGADRNKHLSLAEAELVSNAIAENPADIAAARQAVESQLAELTSGKNADGIRSYFSSTTEDLADVVVAAMRETVAAAKGKPVELHAMIFAFTEQKIADEMIALAKANPNVEIRLVTDFSQVPTTGGRQPPRLHERAKTEGLGARLSVKFKKDTPYSWDSRLGRPVYNHLMSKGLNHHKGVVMLVDGKPHKLVTGSYNWSKTAGSVNYESLFVIDATNPANRKLMADYQDEFAAFFNHKDSLDLPGMKVFKAELTNELRVANGLAPQPITGTMTQGPTYVPRAPAPTFDVNHLSDENYEALKSLLKDSKLVSSIVHQYATYGAFSSFDDLLERVPKLSTLPEERREQLRSNLEFGEGSVPLATASADELVRSLKISKTAALAIIAKRKKVGDFENVDELRGLPGITDAVFARIAPRLNDDLARAFFSAKAVSDSAPKTGYAAANADKKVPVLGLDGTITEQPADLPSGVVDLIHRAKPGDEIKIGQYGLSISAREYSEIIDAAGRGVHFKIVLDKAGNATAAAALKTQAEAGLPIEVRVQKRTMHQKFGTLNDDSFFGSSNFSTSSTNKNSEDRFVVKNNAELAAELSAEHDLLWAKSDPV
jgi:phosphatidylserine/phosphatidylglycerophosphate/cardiolipin synthase-like enzyme